jgi:hypothetical protein
MPQSAQSTGLFAPPSLLLPLITPKFSSKVHNIGTFLAYRMEELGIRDFFAVPGTYMLELMYAWKPSSSRANNTIIDR